MSKIGSSTRVNVAVASQESESSPVQNVPLEKSHIS
jgi:hypothetical protein